MYISLVKKFGILLMVLILSLVTKAQQVHFVYLQTENAQPFYVKFNDKVISSSSEGYIILPGLQDGDYQLVVGFPKREYPEEKFDLSVNKVNEGFLLKNFDGDWKLFNLQTLALTDGISDKPVAVTNTKEVDQFSTMLANVVKDSSILQNHVVKAPAALPADTPGVAFNENLAPVAVADTAHSVVTPPAAISRVLRRADDQGLQMVYIDNQDNRRDTVRIFMPENKITASEDSAVMAKNEPEQKPSVTTSPLTITPTVIEADTATGYKPDTSSYVRRPPQQEVDKSFVFNSNSDSANIVQTESEKSSADTVAENKEVAPVKGKGKAIPVIVLNPTAKSKANTSHKEGRQDELILLPRAVTSSGVNSDCKAFATNEDFLRLRKKMAAENRNDRMISVARKFFKSKCYSTEQVKDLSYLFLTDEGKYMFFDAAYPFTSDSDQYQQLESQFSDEYFLNRFKALLGK